MKNIVYTLLFITPILGVSQKLIFNYDESGYQIKRNQVEQSSRVVNLENLDKEMALLEVENEILKDFVVYPNPTSGPLTLKWIEKYKGKVISISLSDFLGRKEEIEFKLDENEINIDLISKPQGLYIINFYLEDGSRIDKKIIKQN